MKEIQPRLNAIYFLLASTLFGITPSFILPTLTAILLAQRGTDPTLIGLYASTQFVAILLAGSLAAAVVRGLGRRGALFAATALVLLVSFLFGVTDALPAWFALNALWGMTVGVRWVVGESWVAELAPAERRGHFVGLYEVVIGATTFIGPTLLLVTGTDGFVPFGVAALLVLLGLLFLLPVRPARLHEHENMAPDATTSTDSNRVLLRTAPVVLIADLIAGVFESGTTALLPVYAVRIGLGAALAASLVTVVGLGSFLLQYPVGYLADRVPTRRVLTWSMVLILFGAPLLLFADGGPLLWAVALLWGGVGGGLYTLAMIQVGHAFRGESLMRATATLVAVYTLGSALGPSLGGVALDASQRYGLPLLFALFALIGLGALLFTHKAALHVSEGAKGAS